MRIVRVCRLPPISTVVHRGDGGVSDWLYRGVCSRNTARPSVVSIVLAGDFSQLSHFDVIHRTGFFQLVHHSTRAANVLGRIYVSYPHYCAVRVIHSVVKSDHKAIVVYAEHQPNRSKTIETKIYRYITPNHHDIFLQYVSSSPFCY